MSEACKSPPLPIFRFALSNLATVSEKSLGTAWPAYQESDPGQLDSRIFYEGEGFESGPFDFLEAAFELGKERVSFESSGDEGQPDFVSHARAEERGIDLGSPDDERFGRSCRFQQENRLFRRFHGVESGAGISGR